jgi:hypothetical protein
MNLADRKKLRASVNRALTRKTPVKKPRMKIKEEGGRKSIIFEGIFCFVVDHNIKCVKALSTKAMYERISEKNCNVRSPEQVADDYVRIYSEKVLGYAPYFSRKGYSVNTGLESIA